MAIAPEANLSGDFYSALRQKGGEDALTQQQEALKQKGGAVMQATLGFLAQGGNDPSPFFSMIYQAFSYLDASIELMGAKEASAQPSAQNTAQQTNVPLPSIAAAGGPGGTS